MRRLSLLRPAFPLLLGVLALSACFDGNQEPPTSPTSAPETPPLTEVTPTPAGQPTQTPGETLSPTETPVPTDPTSPTESVSPTDSPSGSPTLEPSTTPATDTDGDGIPLEAGDCDDTNASVYPGAAETAYDGIDQDCSGYDLTDVDGDGYDSVQVGGADCDDSSAASYPQAPEVGDGLDNDCDGLVDDGVDSVDNDGDGFSELEGDCDDEDPLSAPDVAEIPYDGIDQDCSGADLTDMDGDSVDGGPVGSDCDDTQPAIHPGADDIPYDGIDQDCSGADLDDMDGDGATGGPSGTDCDDQHPGRSPLLEEVPYDGLDNDCDGIDQVDVDGDGQSASQVGGTDCQDEDDGIYLGAADIPYDGIDQDCSSADLTDVDGDGVDALEVGGTDCNDQDQNSFPGAAEYADGRDNDCDGSVDEDLDTTDDDGDSFSEVGGDCNDQDPLTFPGASEVPYDGIDQNCSGADLTDVDGDGDAGTDGGGPDCNDGDSSVFPGAPETPYDGIDQDCSGTDLTDVDGDGVSASQVGGLDCNDADPLVHTGASEVPYDSIDQDCSGSDLTDVDGDGASSSLTSGGTDCNDADSSIHPTAEERCDQVDNNCDGVIDLDAVDRGTYYVDADHDGYGDPDLEELTCAPTDRLVLNPDDCDDTTAMAYPDATEVCDGIDNNCDSAVDEGVQNKYYRDADGDGYGTSASILMACSPPTGYTTDATDCDDSRAQVYPGGTESCDSLDNDCDGQVDEGVKTTYYQDSDSDDYGSSSVSQQACSAPIGFVTNATDCNDKNQDIHPGAPELCNGKDDDCDSSVDEGVQVYTYYADVDKDGYGNATLTQQTCAAAPLGYVSVSGDCNDSNPQINPGVTELCNGIDDNCSGQADEGVKTTYYQDADKDGYGNPTATTQACSLPAGYVSNSTDCKDTDAAINPAASESCNGADDDCDGTTDEGVKTTWYQDLDKDGYGNSAATQLACTAPAGYVATSGDCKDTDATINPAATEKCNAVDDDCDAQIDEGVKNTYYQDADKDGYGNPTVTTQACSAPLGYVSDNTDCNDTAASAHPGGTEVCNSIDDDCDGTTDEGVTKTYYQDADGDNYGNPNVSTQACGTPDGYVVSATDCDDTRASVHPNAAEVCNGLDDDCDAQVDESVSATWYQDSDGDGYGNASVSSQACAAPAGYVGNKTDCNDANAAVNPGAQEVCDSSNVDEDCDGVVDNQDVSAASSTKTSFYQDYDRDGYGSKNSYPSAYCDNPTNTTQAWSANNTDCNDNSAAINPGAQEICDSVNADEDCDGAADDNDASVSTATRTNYYIDADKDGYGASGSTATSRCDDPSTSSQKYASNNLDCNDSSASINPGRTESPNGVDDNCNGQIDEGVYFPSCLQLKATTPSATSGTYTIDPDGSAGPKKPLTVFCDMTTAGGGWTILQPQDIGSGLLDLQSYRTNFKQVIFYLNNQNGKQYYTLAEQLPAYNIYDVVVSESADRLTATFIPRTIAAVAGATQGFRSNGRDITFTNCDANPNSYLEFYKAGAGYNFAADYGVSLAWRDSKLELSGTLPTSFYTVTAIHFGGCGTHSTSQNWAAYDGSLSAALGVR